MFEVFIMARVVMVLAVVACVLSWHASAQTCLLKFSGQSQTYATCNSLPKLGATLSWTYHPQNGSVDLAFRANPGATAGWVGWGINPEGQKMIGTQALIAFKNSSGSIVVHTYDYQSQSAISPSNISITVYSMSAASEDNTITIFASLELPSNKTDVSHVWQTGSSVSGTTPQIHPLTGDNLLSLGTINLQNGTTSAASGRAHQTLRNRHGVLNVVGWGIMMPIGAMIARYVKTFESADPAWFYLHAFCQSAGYVIGVSGWATGLKLGSYSKGVEQTSHRRLGIALFCLGTLQVFALLLRPKKDHKYRIYWNVYHHSIGYSVIVLSIINIFKGFDILDPEKKWKNAYIGVIASLGGIALVLEVVTWIIVLRRKSTSPSKSGNGMNANGNGLTQSHPV